MSTFVVKYEVQKGRTVTCKMGVAHAGAKLTLANFSGEDDEAKQEKIDKIVGLGSLKAIPFTGVFGSGFGNMGRWDLFGIGSGIWGGGIVLACLFACACSGGENASAEGTSLCMSCWGCVWALGIAAYWIWGIVVIANKTEYGPNGCPLH